MLPLTAVMWAVISLMCSFNIVPFIQRIESMPERGMWSGNNQGGPLEHWQLVNSSHLNAVHYSSGSTHGELSTYVLYHRKQNSMGCG